MLCIVTGSNGFIGRHLVRGLKEIATVVPCDIDGNAVAPRLAGLMLQQSVGPKMVFHFGACSSTTERRGPRLHELNVASTEEWVRIASMSSTPIVFASSFGVYGDGPKSEAGEHCLTEYARSKWQAEQILRRHYSKFAAILRLTNVWGPGEETKPGQSFVYWAAKKIAAGEPVPIFAPNPARDWLPVSKLVAICRTLVYRAVGGLAFPNGTHEVGSGEPMTFSEMARLAGEAIGRPNPDLEFVPLPEKMEGRYQGETRADSCLLENVIGSPGRYNAAAIMRGWLSPIFCSKPPAPFQFPAPTSG